MQLIDGETYALPPQIVEADPPPATLLSSYDEYISYARDQADLDRTRESLADILRRSGLLLLDGAVAGRWTRRIRSTTVEIEVRTATTVTGTAREAVEREARAFGAFIGRDVRLTVSG